MESDESKRKDEYLPSPSVPLFTQDQLKKIERDKNINLWIKVITIFLLVFSAIWFIYI